MEPVSKPIVQFDLSLWWLVSKFFELVVGPFNAIKVSTQQASGAGEVLWF